jgi:hypothetical protein
VRLQRLSFLFFFLKLVPCGTWLKSLATQSRAGRSLDPRLYSHLRIPADASPGIGRVPGSQMGPGLRTLPGSRFHRVRAGCRCNTHCAALGLWEAIAGIVNIWRAREWRLTIV